MKYLSNVRIGSFFWVLSASFVLVSCGASRKNHYERLNLQRADSLVNSTYSYPEFKFQPGDLLSILVFSDNAEATLLYNQSQNGGSAAGGAMGSGSSGLNSSSRGYQVDAAGYIYFHDIGKIKVSGMTKHELSTLLVDSLKVRYLKNPYVTVRMVNARVTVIGEVTRPGLVDMPDQKMSVLDAIAFAGDFTIFARRDNVVVIRETNGKRQVGYIDTRSAVAYTSPYFYLEQNDLVYIEPNRKKPTGNEQLLVRNITIVTSILSIITLMITLLTR